MFNNKKTAIILSGGGMSSAYSGGALYSLANENILKTPDFLIAGSGGIGNAMYFLSEQYESMKRIWTERALSTSKFINKIRFWKIVNIDYLIDDILKKEELLDVNKVKSSLIEGLIPIMNAETNDLKFFSNRDDVDLFEVVRAGKAIPVFYNKKVRIEDRYYFDFSPSPYKYIEKARELGAEKIVLVDNQLNTWYMRIGYFLFLMWSDKRIRILFDKYKEEEKKAKNLEKNKDVFILKPKNLLKTGLLNNRGNILKAVFDQGLKDASKNESLRKFLIS